MTKEPTTIEKIMHIERRIEGQTSDMLGLFQTFFYDLITLHKLRDALGDEMIADAFGDPSHVTTQIAEMNMQNDTQKRPFDLIPYDDLKLVDKRKGDYDSIELVLRGQLGTYRLRIGHSITDSAKIYDVYQNDKLFATLYPTIRPSSLAGLGEDGAFYTFRLLRNGIDVLVRREDRNN